jgi:hypothetical protein
MPWYTARPTAKPAVSVRFKSVAPTKLLCQSGGIDATFSVEVHPDGLLQVFGGLSSELGEPVVQEAQSPDIDVAEILPRVTLQTPAEQTP